MPARAYQEIRSWSSSQGGWVRRVSVADDRAKEFYMIVADPGSGARRRASRGAALDLIVEAIDRGDQPGEVRVTPTEWSRRVAEHLARLSMEA